MYVVTTTLSEILIKKADGTNNNNNDAFKFQLEQYIGCLCGQAFDRRL